MRCSRLPVMLFGVLLGVPGLAMAQSDPLPPPPVYTPPPAQPYAPQPYAQPYAPQPYAPTYAPQPAYAPRVVQFRPQMGLGLRVMGSWNVNAFTDYGQGGIGGELLFRAHPRLTVELTGMWQGTSERSEYENGYRRYDVPVTAGLRVHLGNPRWLVSPYLAVAAGGVWARAYVPILGQSGYALEGRDTGWFAEGQLGGGLELRLGRHAAINLDARAATRLRVDRQQRLEVYDALGRTVPVMGNQFGLQFHLGLGFYF